MQRNAWSEENIGPERTNEARNDMEAAHALVAMHQVKSPAINIDLRGRGNEQENLRPALVENRNIIDGVKLS